MLVISCVFEGSIGIKRGGSTPDEDDEGGEEEGEEGEVGHHVAEAVVGGFVGCCGF